MIEMIFDQIFKLEQTVFILLLWTLHTQKINLLLIIIIMIFERSCLLVYNYNIILIIYSTYIIY